jgi:4-amino-4-deoxy-L-arabinose transferase-like glycosyltransferase
VTAIHTSDTSRRRPLARADVGIAGEVAVVVAVTTAIGLAFWGLGAAMLDAPGFLDPWIYRALFRNFDYLYRTFNSTYYTSRLPWIIPGQATHAVFGPVWAFFVLHGIFILASGLSVYLLVRQFFGRAVAVAAYAGLLLNVLFFNAHSDDYTDGPQITYLLLTLACALLSTQSRRPALWMLTSGFFAAAAIGTNLFDVFFVGGAALAYLAVVSVRERFFGQLIRDVAAFVAGAGLLLVALGGYAKAHGGEFLFFMPSVRAAQALPAENWRALGFGWVDGEPRLLIIPFLVALAVVILYPQLHRWRVDPGVRFAAGLTMYLAVVAAGLFIWEFVLGGVAVFETSYYFSVFTAAFVPTAAATIGLVTHDAGSPYTFRKSWMVALAVAAAALADVLVYSSRLDGLFGRTAFIVDAVAMSAILVLAVAVYVLRTPAVGARIAKPVLIAGTLFSINFAAAGSLSSLRFSTHTGAPSYHSRVVTLHLSDQLIDFVRDEGLQSTAPGSVPPAFWIDESDAAVNSVQAAYLYAWTAAGYDLPRIDLAMRTTLRDRRAQVIVLLCTRWSCDDGAAALRRSGYRPRLRAARRLASGGKELWARAYTLPGFAGGAGQIPSFYAPSHNSLATTAGSGIRTWNLGGGGVASWTGASMPAAVAARGKPFATTRYVSGNELVSPQFRLPAGRYRVFLRGRVLRGGLDLGVLDAEENTWISHGYYWYGQRWRLSRWMTTPFKLDRRTRIKIILLNWVPHEMRSQWQLKDLRVVRVR